MRFKKVRAQLTYYTFMIYTKSGPVDGIYNWLFLIDTYTTLLGRAYNNCAIGFEIV